MNRRIRPWGWALVGSLLLHAALFGGLKWELPQWSSPSEAPPLALELVATHKPVVAPLPPPAPTPIPQRVLPSKPRAPAVEPVPEPEATAELPFASPIAAEGAGADAADSPALPPEMAAPAEPAPPRLNALPPRLDLRYRLSYGIANGEQTLVWVNEGERYTLTSVATATGLAGIFYRGQFAQTSRGRITPTGLQPEDFWDQRGSKHSRASFDANQGQLVLVPDHGVPRHFSYQGAVQDALSLFFQLALTAPPSGEQLEYRVFNGKKLRDYRYDVLGEETLGTRLGALRTLHLMRAGSGDGRFEIWLAIDRHYLPVRVRRSDEAGSEMELSILSITP
ncbi:MAG: DUF3108 domain-containing protein [Thiobacillus sp.]|nr:DUF3108 domain-containing protein [Thiobacillus sp.]